MTSEDSPNFPIAAKRRLSTNVLLLVALIALTSVALWMIEPRVMSSGNIYNLARNAALLAVVAVGQMLVMKSGGFDLSVGGTAALSSVTAAVVMTSVSASAGSSEGLVITLGIMTALATGLLVGCFNGVMVTLFSAPPFMVTLGMLSIVTGLAMYLTAGIPIYGLPPSLTRSFARGDMLGVSNLIWVCVLIVTAVAVLEFLTPFGRHLRAVGGNKEASRLSGVRTDRVVLAVYILSGVLGSLAGFLLTARLGSGQSTAGLDLMLQSIAIAVLGGVSLQGGFGRLERVTLAAIFLALVANGMNLVRLDSRYQPIVIGVFLIGASLIEMLAKREPSHGA